MPCQAKVLLGKFNSFFIARHVLLPFQPELPPSLPKFWKCVRLELQSLDQVGHSLGMRMACLGGSLHEQRVKETNSEILSATFKSNVFIVPKTQKWQQHVPTLASTNPREKKRQKHVKLAVSAEHHRIFLQFDNRAAFHIYSNACSCPSCQALG